MKRKISAILLFMLSISSLTYANDQIEKNKKRIKQIDSQVNKNNQKINKNNTEISKAKKTENATVAQVKKLDANIKKLEAEQKEAEKKYNDLIKKININTININTDIEEINKSTEIINNNRNDLNNKIKIWDKIRRNQEAKKDNIKNLKISTISENSKLNHDLRILFNGQKHYIKNVEIVRKEFEDKKANEELLKAKNETEANEVNIAKENLHKKNKELKLAKAEKNKLINQLRGKQKTLNTENKKIQSDNSKLVAEKNKLNAQIQAIIQKAIKEREEAEKKAKEAEARKKQASSQSSGSKASSNSKTSQISKTTSNVPRAKGTGSLIRPISGPIVVNFGQEKVAGLKSNGIEIRGTLGQSVKAADSGSVIYSGNLSNLGGVVIIDHGNLVTVYGNLSAVSVSKGTKVTKGQNIGTLGREQTSKEPNLYFEIRKGISIVNPTSYI